LVTCSTGKSAGREPFRIRFANPALRFSDSTLSVPYERSAPVSAQSAR
jgi:hypothetical protein